LQSRGLFLRNPQRYHVLVHSLAERVLSHIRRQELLSAGERIGVAVSGGIDSVALLRLLLELRGELGIVLSVVHFNHKLRGAESDSDQEFVSQLAREHDLQFYCAVGDVARHAVEKHVSVEAAARELRYAFFRALLGGSSAEGLKPESIHPPFRVPEGSPSLNKVVTAHTLDDQAETVLLRIIRGAGLRGIAGIYPKILVEDEDGDLCADIVRPLLTTRRRHLEEYLQRIGQHWREDATNASTKFTRNRVRKLLLPFLENEFNPSVAENLAELAEIARAEEDYWQNEVAGWMGTGVHWSEPAWARKPELVQIGAGGAAFPGGYRPTELDSKIDHAAWLVMNASVDRLWFVGEPLAVQRRVIKAIGEEAGIPLEFKHVDEVLRFALQEEVSGGEISLPLGWKVTREPDEILFVTPDLRESRLPEDYEYELPIPGEVNVYDIGSKIIARRVPADAGYNPEHLLDGASLAPALKVRNWRAGDRFWPSHTKSPKKIKELLQERHVPHPERRLWPVLVRGDEIIWMRGFPAPARFAAKPGGDGVEILESPLLSGR
jgi:tRNA(Ile)-lysidine synthase